MASISSSSSRTVLDGVLSKQPIHDGDEESLINLDGLKILNMDSCHSFDFLNWEELMSYVPKVRTPLSPRTLAVREKYERVFN